MLLNRGVPSLAVDFSTYILYLSVYGLVPGNLGLAQLGCVFPYVVSEQKGVSLLSSCECVWTVASLHSCRVLPVEAIRYNHPSPPRLEAATPQDRVDKNMGEGGNTSICGTVSRAMTVVKIQSQGQEACPSICTCSVNQWSKSKKSVWSADKLIQHFIIKVSPPYLPPSLPPSTKQICRWVNLKSRLGTVKAIINCGGLLCKIMFQHIFIANLGGFKSSLYLIFDDWINNLQASSGDKLNFNLPCGGVSFHMFGKWWLLNKFLGIQPYI